MKSSSRKRKLLPPGDDLWDWAERRTPPPPASPAVREEPPSRPAWYRGVLQKIAGQA